MTNEEIHEYINIRGGRLGGDEILAMVNTDDKPQIDHVKFEAGENKIHMWAKDGDHFEFTPIPYEEYVKTKKK